MICGHLQETPAAARIIHTTVSNSHMQAGQQVHQHDTVCDICASGVCVCVCVCVCASVCLRVRGRGRFGCLTKVCGCTYVCK